MTAVYAQNKPVLRASTDHLALVFKEHQPNRYECSNLWHDMNPLPQLGQVISSTPLVESKAGRRTRGKG